MATNSIILRGLTLREHNAVQVTLSHFEWTYWGIDETRAGNLRFPNVPAVQYVVCRLRDMARVTDNQANARGAVRVADKLDALIG